MPAGVEAPSRWKTSFAVDVDAVIDQVENNGGQVHMPAMDMQTVGRIGVVADPPGSRQPGRAHGTGRGPR